MNAGNLSTFYSVLGQSEVFQTGQIVDFYVVEHEFDYIQAHINLRNNTGANYAAIERMFSQHGIRFTTRIINGRMTIVLS